MAILETETFCVQTRTGEMNVHLFRPSRQGCFPAVVLYSEIFQITAPIRRMAAFFAGHGYLVACPEIYHEHLPAGTVLAYDQDGSDRGNELKYIKPVEDHDSDATALISSLSQRQDCTGIVGVLGICLGGHLAFRAAFDPRVRAAACFYATDLHKASLGKGDDSLTRTADIQGELLMVWGRQDPHVPTEGRMKILTAINEAGVRLQWHEVNGAHAFLRDEGPRYDPALAHTMYSVVLAFFASTLHSR